MREVAGRFVQVAIGPDYVLSVEVLQLATRFEEGNVLLRRLVRASASSPGGQEQRNFGPIGPPTAL